MTTQVAQPPRSAGLLQVISRPLSSSPEHAFWRGDIPNTKWGKWGSKRHLSKLPEVTELENGVENFTPDRSSLPQLLCLLCVCPWGS